MFKTRNALMLRNYRLQESVDALTEQNDDLQRWVTDLQEQLRAVAADLHTLRSSPEIKADTEAAFSRGIQHARRQLGHGLRQWVENFQVVEEA